MLFNVTKGGIKRSIEDLNASATGGVGLPGGIVDDRDVRCLRQRIGDGLGAGLGDPLGDISNLGPPSLSAITRRVQNGDAEKRDELGMFRSVNPKASSTVPNPGCWTSNPQTQLADQFQADELTNELAKLRTSDDSVILNGYTFRPLSDQGARSTVYRVTSEDGHSFILKNVEAVSISKIHRKYQILRDKYPYESDYFIACLAQNQVRQEYFMHSIKLSRDLYGQFYGNIGDQYLVMPDFGKMDLFSWIQKFEYSIDTCLDIFSQLDRELGKMVTSCGIWSDLKLEKCCYFAKWTTKTS